jgi:hypothetical protein
MREGKCFCIYLENLHVDFHDEYTDKTIFPADKIFDSNYWRENYEEHLTKEELSEEFKMD